MNEIYVNELIVRAVNNFKETSEEGKSYFTKGNSLEILTDDGKKHIIDSINNALTKELKKAKEQARKLLVEKGVVNALERKISDNALRKSLLEKSNNLQLEYQKAYAKVKELERTLIDFLQ